MPASNNLLSAASERNALLTFVPPPAPPELYSTAARKGGGWALTVSRTFASGRSATPLALPNCSTSIFNAAAGTECLLSQRDGSEVEVFLSYLHANAVASTTRRGQTCRASTEERIEHRVTNEAEHPHEPVCQLHRERSRVQFRGCAGHVGPNLPEPLPVILR